MLEERKGGREATKNRKEQTGGGKQSGKKEKNREKEISDAIKRKKSRI